MSHALSREGYTVTLFAPARFAAALLADPWVETVIDSEAPENAGAFAGLGLDGRTFDRAVVISRSEGLLRSFERSAARVVAVDPVPRGKAHVARQWCEDAGLEAPDFPPVIGPIGRIDGPRRGAPDAGPADGGSGRGTDVILHPGSGSPAKNWSIEGFRACADALRREGRRVAWLTGPAEREANRDVAPSAAADERLDAPRVADLLLRLASCDLFIGNDSGPAHLAAACGAPAVVVYGPTDPSIWRPDAPSVATVRAPSERLEDVAVADVLSAARRLPSRA